MEVLASYQRSQSDNRARYAADRTLLPSQLIGNETKSAVEMNETKSAVEMNETKSTIEMNPNNSSNPMNSLNPLSQSNSLHSLNPLSQSNSLNSLNPLNQSNSLNSLNPLSQSNTFNSLNSLNSLNQSHSLNSLNGDLLHPSIPIERFPSHFLLIHSSNRDYARGSGTRTADRVFSERCQANAARNRRVRDREKPERHSNAESDAQAAPLGRASAHRGSGYAALSAGILQRYHSFGVVGLVCG